MTDRDDLAARLDDVADTLGDTPPREWGPTIVYTTDDGYETPDGDPVPTDADGDPVPTDADGDPAPPNARADAPIIIYRGLYGRPFGDARGGA